MRGAVVDAVAVVLGWLVPLLIVGYVIWLLTRLTQTVERIEWRLAQLLESQDEADRLDQ